jgi:hypothetical protein
VEWAATEYMTAILISVSDIKKLKTWLAINEESIYELRMHF